MNDFNPVWGPEIAAQYEQHLRGDEEAAVAFLASYGEGGRALEFAIGTGRIAIPLLTKGIPVEGIELSPHMAKKLQAKVDGKAIEVTIGDMSRATTGRQYKLVYLVYNTIFNLLTADDQICCFQNAAQHLADGGVFIIEAALPHAWIAPGKSDYVHAEQVETDSVTFDVARYDPVTQLLTENHVQLSTAGIQMSPIVTRLITPGEMDLMARIAGMRLLDRFANWQRSPFASDSVAHISVYGLDTG